MFKIAALVWIMLATTLAGIALLVVVTVPSLANEARFLIPVACGGAVVAAMPLSYIIARQISDARSV
ncbi:hypothetical protein [Hyphomicrobium sp. CS1GBMeth3]|uniref:hypothetical protein n=1 Tax=Hyphomicrobium sp. CS1GBMeth3 TaxID=1892845 RepID=UPI0009310F08|nr:hypothetical protein [Hyphomicrobium sp. CS1GBMeth3]